MVNKSLRWLNEDATIVWRGYHLGREVTNVWPGALVGNFIGEWAWRLIERPLSGSVVATGNDQHDLCAAQCEAERAYFATV